MKNLIRKWILHFKRKRYHRHLRESGNYKTLEKSVKDTGTLCSNCNAPLTGPFCHICGQKDDDLKRPIWTLLREILDDVFSTDSRLFKTLILLVLVPGGLTRAFREGRRARFVPPLRLYLVVSIMFFLIIKFADILILDIHVTALDEPEVADVPQTPEVPGRAQAGEESGEAASMPDQEQGAADSSDPGSKSDTSVPKTMTPEELQALAKSALTPEEKVRKLIGDKRFDALPEETKQAIRDGAADGNVKIDGVDLLQVLMSDGAGPGDGGEDSGGINIGLPYNVDVAMFVRNTGDERESLKQEDLDKVLDDPKVPTVLKRATVAFADALKNPEQFNELFNDWLPPALFVLMPFFALILRVFHWGKDRVYLQQFVFSLHFHTFLFLLMTAMTVIVPTYGGDLSVGIFWWGTSLYLVIALKIGQGQGWLKAFFKAGPIWVTYFLVMASVMLIVVFAGLGDIDVIDLLMGDTSAFQTES